jgi:hypothetical protein
MVQLASKHRKTERVRTSKTRFLRQPRAFNATNEVGDKERFANNPNQTTTPSGNRQIIEVIYVLSQN